jgi:hypothetical protein
MKRQRGRHNGRKPHHHQPHNPNLPIRSQTFDSNGPDVRVRGNAFQILEKYVAMARDAQAAGDRVAAESYFQHAEHYFRLINESGGYQQRHQGHSGHQGGHGGHGGDPRGNPGAGHDPQSGGAQVQPAPQAGGIAAMAAHSSGGATVTPTGYAAINAANAANAGNGDGQPE